MIAHQALRFALVGVVNTAVYYALYLVVRVPLGYLAAHFVALVVAMVVSFLLNARFTYHVRPTWRRFLLFPLGNLASYGTLTAGVVLLVALGVSETTAPLLAAAGAIPVTFLLTRWLLVGRPAGDPR